ncbi:MAG: insulinase family protein [Rikenellaceae bacterium]
MKKLFLFLSLLIVSLSLSAQEIDMMGIVPNDPEVRTGTLENGAKYYIRRNTKDPERANFHIMYKVGAILEEDRQNGLAHFLEHMAFNGSDSFQGNGLIDYCQSIGVEFGRNLNAATSQEFTTYMITDVPIVREGIIDSMLLVLHDWAGFISLNEEDIDDERQVIQEERRMVYASADRRLYQKSMGVLYGDDNIYTLRDVIGPVENLQNFSYQDIRDFYHKWYRPDLQTFVIVGDFDAEVMEQKLIKTMSNIKEFEDKTPLPKAQFAGNKEPRFAVLTDPELSSPYVRLVCKTPSMPTKYNNRFIAVKTVILNEMVADMVNDRIADIAKTPGAPFLNGWIYKTDLFVGMDGFMIQAGSAVGKELEAFEAVYTEALRAIRGGFAIPELDRAKTDYLAILDTQLERKDDRRNQSFVEQYSDNFYDNVPFPSIEDEYAYTTAIVEAITLEEVNAQIASMLTEENVVLFSASQEKEGAKIPTVEELQALYEKVNASEIEPYTEEVVTRPLLDASKLKGSKVKKVKEGKFDSEVWTLKNGIQVVVKPTDFQSDEIRFYASRKGGTSSISDLETLYSISLLSSFDAISGVSDFTDTELTRALTGKMCSAAPTIGAMTEGFRGNSNKKDLETMFQLLYLYATAPRAEQADWDVMTSKIEAQIEGSKNDPMRIFQETVTATIYNNDPRNLPIGEEYLENISLEAFKAEYANRFSYVNDMTFFIVGSVDTETLKPLVEKYIGSLPLKKKAPKAEFGTIYTDMVKGEVVNHFSTPQETERSIVVILASGDVDYSLEESINLDVAGQILDNTYTRTIREEAGGVYVVQNMMQVVEFPKEQYINQCLFLTEPSKLEELIPLVQEGIDSLLINGPTAEELHKIVLANDKNYTNGLRQNGTWLNNLVNWYINGVDDHTDYKKVLDKITTESVQEAAKRAFTQGNRIELVQLP